MNRYKKIGLTIGICLLLFMVWGYFNVWRSPKYYMQKNSCNIFENILTMKQYGELVNTHKRPYVYNNENILVFGSEHTKNPDDPQLKMIETSFKELKPTTVLVEGRLGFFIPNVMNPVKKFGENGKVAELARKNDAQIYSWETPKNELLNALQDKFEAERIALKEILTPYFGNLRFGKPKSPEAFVQDYLFRAEWLGVQDKINTIQDIDSIWKKDFPNEKDWRDTNDQWGLPGYLAEISDYSNFIRNQNLVCTINDLIDKGERVFVICGSSHAVCIENEIID